MVRRRLLLLSLRHVPLILLMTKVVLTSLVVLNTLMVLTQLYPLLIQQQEQELPLSG
jgi:hypothetical protein